MQRSIRNFKKKTQGRIQENKESCKSYQKKESHKKRRRKRFRQEVKNTRILFDGIFLDSAGKIRPKHILQKDKIRFFRQETCIEGMQKRILTDNQDKQESGKNDIRIVTSNRAKLKPTG